MPNIKWKIALSAYSGKNRNKDKRQNKAQMSVKRRSLRKEAAALLFCFWAARVVAGGWLRCEDEAAVRRFSLFPTYLDL